MLGVAASGRRVERGGYEWASPAAAEAPLTPKQLHQLFFSPPPLFQEKGGSSLIKGPAKGGSRGKVNGSHRRVLKDG